MKCIWGNLNLQIKNPDDQNVAVMTLWSRHEGCDVIVARIKAAAISGQGLEPYVTICHELLQDLGRVQAQAHISCYEVEKDN